MESNFIVVSTSGERKVTVISSPCNGDTSYVTYQLFDNDVRFASGVCKPAEISKVVRAWARRMLVGVTSVKQA